jgi:hypothetical protein
MSDQRPAVSRSLRRSGWLVAVLAASLALASSVSAAGPQPPMDPMAIKAVRPVHGAPPARPPKASANLLWHNGAILTSTVVQSIFWGTSWNSPGDKISGLDKFYTGVGGTPYMNSNTEYKGTNGTVGSGVTFNGHFVDLAAGPTTAPSTAAVLAEVSKMITNPVANGYYPVYIDGKRGNAGYCAWHSYGTVHGVLVQFGFFFNLDGDPGCDPADTGTIHSQGLEAVANVSGHELSETVTDPRDGGWWDRSGAENADKCAWTFSGHVTIGGQAWLIQGNWSNAANNTKSGYNKAGCIETR